KNPGADPFADVSLESLKRRMEKAVKNEDYEKAEEIKKEIDKRHDCAI
ncbi:MAG: UvrB/UvrC motif-containing protein, partial [Muribaculaceae bacterium]|nr:UvrB/UvrC motif-containing protein [Muribaculaceae bacterium]